MRFFRALATACLASSHVSAKAVFAHFMMGNTIQYTASDFLGEIQAARAAGIDGFAINMARDEATSAYARLQMIFTAARAAPPFKLFFSFDFAGNGPWDSGDVVSTINDWKSNPAYFLHSNGQPLVSTFEGPANANDWHAIKDQTKSFFIPDWSSLGARKAVSRGDGVADGLFNWGAWPEGKQRTNWDLDASYLIFLNNTRTYMASISPWFYTNMPGFNKNWLWSGGTTWYDRWQQLGALSVVGKDQWPGQPEYIQIISWNDFGESHYIGPLNDKAYEAFHANRGNSPFNYVQGYPHDGWRAMLPFMISMWKTGTGVVSQEILTTWYRLTPGNACASGGTIGNNPDQDQQVYPPTELSPDKIYFAALLTGPLTPKVYLQGRALEARWESQPETGGTGGVGMYFGSADTKGATGGVIVALVDGNGNIAANLIAEKPISATCSNSVMNWNAWVSSTTGSRAAAAASPKTPLSQQQCVSGGGSKPDFEELCAFTCYLGYCPPGPCTCYQLGKNTRKDSIVPKNIEGYVMPGGDCTYKGLCAFACNWGKCTDKCTTVASAKDKCVMAVEAPDTDNPDRQCTSGTGEGGFAGLCSYSCGRGYCPSPPCKCTGWDKKITPPPKTSAPGYPGEGRGLLFKGLCNFACSRGYCPEPDCTYKAPFGGIFIEFPSCDKLSPKDEMYWYCNLQCKNLGDLLTPAKKQWTAAKGNEFLDWAQDFAYSYGSKEEPDGFMKSKLDGLPIDQLLFAYAGNDEDGNPKQGVLTECEVLSTSGSCSSANAYKCGTTEFVSLDLYMQSVVNLHNFFNTMYNSFVVTQINIVSRMKAIAQSFFEEDKALAILKKILGLFSLLLGFASSGAWSSMFGLTTLADFSSVIGEAASTFTGAFEAIADVASSKAKTRVEVTQTLEDAAAAIFSEARDAVTKHVTEIFTGGGYGLRTLHRYLKDGLFLDSPKLSTQDFNAKFLPIITAQSIVQTWRMDGSAIAVIYVKGNVTDRPFDHNGGHLILGSDYEKMRVHVDETYHYGKYIPTSPADPFAPIKLELAKDRAAYTLFLGQTQLCGGNGKPGSCAGGMAIPQGLDRLKDQKNEWGVSKDDIALSSFYGWFRTRETNYFRHKDHKLDLTATIPKGFGMDTYMGNHHVPYQSGVRTPGLYKIPVCSAKLYVKNLNELELREHKRCDYYPCCPFEGYEE